MPSRRPPGPRGGLRGDRKRREAPKSHIYLARMKEPRGPKSEICSETVVGLPRQHVLGHETTYIYIYIYIYIARLKGPPAGDPHKDSGSRKFI